ncbi:lysosome-associated membrane glycoprotein 1-like [Euwallacea fornicatus]|uniref:lysosome-associated membrane glycoprotein 1-like n=1 Tax=Euwallacea fornicatus TaxID=995702 RepID=UPI00338E2377
MLLKSLLILLGVSWAFTKDVSNGTGIDPPFNPNGPSSVSPNSSTITPVTTTSVPPPSPNSTTTSKPTTPSPHSTTTSMPPPSPNSTTTSKPTTPSPNSTTTSMPPPSPNSTTTSKPTTPSPSTTTISTSTTSSTTAAPTTTTSKPDNNPAVNDYFGNYTGTEYICLMARIQIQVEVLTKDKTKSTVVNVPKTATSQVSCSSSNNSIESLTINWYNNNITFQLLKNSSKFDVEFINTTISLPGSNATTYYHKKPEFSVSDKMSYYCTKEQLLNLTGDQSNETLAILHLSHFHYQGFMNTTKTNDYSSVWDCDGANTSDAVPVVVGCVLAVLVVLVLAAYLVGRRRCQARGYLSMFSQERDESDYIPMKNLSCFN